MQKQKKERVLSILDADPERFDYKYNRAMDRLTGEGAEIDTPRPYRTTDGFFCAVITYRDVVTVYANVKEEYLDKGERYYCTDCPLYRTNSDGRRRGGQCARKSHIDPGATACVRFYEDLATGEVEPVGR